MTINIIIKNCEFTASWLFSEVILQKRRHIKRNLGSSVKNCPKVSVIYLSESVRRGWMLIACYIYWGIRPGSHGIAQADADKGKLNKLVRLEVNKSQDNI